MNAQKYTQKSLEAVQAAQDIALARGSMQIEEEHLREYMLSYLETITVVSTCIGYVSNDPVNLKKVKDLWKYIKDKDPRTYHHLRWGALGHAMNLPGRFGRYLSVKAYKISQRFMGFN